jgi:hypothetical protein
LFNLVVHLAHAGRGDEARAYGARYLAIAPHALERDIRTIKEVMAK